MIVKEMIFIATKKQMTKTKTTVCDPPEHDVFSSLNVPPEHDVFSSFNTSDVTLFADVTLFLNGSSVIES